MKVNFTYYNTNIYATNRKNNVVSNSINKNIQKNSNHTSFNGAPIEKLYEEYNWYINCDRVSAINSFLKINAPKETMNEFFANILSTKDRSYELIDSIVNQPRKSDEILEKLRQKLGENSKLLLTFMQNSPYNEAYTNYIEQKYNRANTLNELLRIRPDWKGSALMEKYQMLSGNSALSIGRIPKQIGRNHLYKIIDYLSDKMEVGIKSNKNINSIVLDGKTYEFKYFTEGKSSKNVFGLFVPSEGKKYVIKMEDTANKSLDAPFALGTLAKIDGYLTANRSRNSAPLCYYDHNRNFSIYKYIEHANVKENPNNLNTIRKNLPDFKALGLDYNDSVGFKNFFVLNEKSSDTHYKMEGFQEALNKSEWISVDNDHVTYANKLQPALSKYHAALPNAMGMFF